MLPESSAAQVIVELGHFASAVRILKTLDRRSDESMPKGGRQSERKSRFANPNSIALPDSTHTFGRTGRDDHREFGTGNTLILL